MADTDTCTPAIFWRVFFLMLAPPVFAQPAATTPPTELSQFGRPDAAEAARFLAEFRRSGIPGEYYLEFELHALPRRGATKVFAGRMWGGGNQQGAINRVEVTDGEGRRHRLLVQAGEQPGLWRLTDGKVSQLAPEELFTPLITGVEVTAFDLQRAYLYWPDATLQSTNRVLGRPAYAYLFKPPRGFSSGKAGVAAVRAYFDTQYRQPVQSELLDSNRKVLKTFTVGSLKTVDVGGNAGEKLTVPNKVDFRNEVTRDKTRLEITALGFNAPLPRGVFEPVRLTAEMPAPADRLIRIEP